MRRASLEHNAITLQAWLRAARTFAEQLNTAENKDPKVLFDGWVETANRTLIETQRSEPYLRTQAALIRASTDLKEAQRDLTEYYGERFGFPTRKELDDVHRTVTELRRELRSLQRQSKASGTTGG
jgi:polyhydroxyalkanoate synthesis regulator phasin